MKYTKLTYEEWKSKYCRLSESDYEDLKKFHPTADIDNEIEQLAKQDYAEYVDRLDKLENE